MGIFLYLCRQKNGKHVELKFLEYEKDMVDTRCCRLLCGNTDG